MLSRHTRFIQEEISTLRTRQNISEDDSGSSGEKEGLDFSIEDDETSGSDYLLSQEVMASANSKHADSDSNNDYKENRNSDYSDDSPLEDTVVKSRVKGMGS